MTVLAHVDEHYEQRITALQRANEVRVFKAALKMTLPRSDDPHGLAASIVRFPEGMEGAMTVSEVLCALPRIAKGKANQIAARNNLSLHRMLRDMYPPQRERLARAIEKIAAERADRA